jgi:hypothetical protein
MLAIGAAVVPVPASVTTCVEPETFPESSVKSISAENEPAALGASTTLTGHWLPALISVWQATAVENENATGFGPPSCWF